VLSSSLEVCSPANSLVAAELDPCALDDRRWLSFMSSQPDATLFHHPVWSRLLTDTYGHRALVLVQRASDGQITAGLPVLEIRGLLGGRRLRALPFTDHCPPLASSPAALARFTTNLTRWLAVEGVRRMTIHGQLAAAPGVHLVTRAVRHVLPLGRTSSEILGGFKGGPVDRAIRKAERNFVQTRISRSPDDLALFYRLHVETRRRLGVPVQPRRFIDTLWHDVLGAGLGFVVIASDGQRPMAAALFLAWNRNLIYKFSASDPRYWELRPNNIVIWTAIDWACQHGYRLLDFGRSDFDNQGLRNFKARWGARELPLVYSYIGGAPSGSTASVPIRALAAVIRSSPSIVCRMMGEILYRNVGANVN